MAFGDQVGRALSLQKFKQCEAVSILLFAQHIHERVRSAVRADTQRVQRQMAKQINETLLVSARFGADISASFLSIR